MNNEYSYEIKKILKDAELEMLDLHHPYVGTEHLLLSLLKNSHEIKVNLTKYNITYDTFKKELLKVIGCAAKKSICILYTPMLKKVLNSAINMVDDTPNKLKPVHLLGALLQENEGIAISILESLNIDITSLTQDTVKQIDNKTTYLNTFATNLTSCISLEDSCLFRESEINSIIETLIRKNKNNCLLIGDAGVGKTAIVEELARRIKKNEVPEILRNTEIYSLDMSLLVAGTKYRGEFEEKINKMISQINGYKNIILFIDEIHTMVNAGGAEGAISAKDILKPYLARGTITVIGATTLNEYNKYILKDKALARRFEVINITEPSDTDTINILNGLKPSFESYYQLKISDENIKDIVYYSNEFILNKCNPDKSIDVLDSICAMKSNSNRFIELNNLEKKLSGITSLKKQMVCNNDFIKAIELVNEETKIKNNILKKRKEKRKITKEDIIKYLKKKNSIPDINDNTFLKLNNYLNDSLIGQSKSIERIINTLKNKEQNKPASIFLSGSTGVGKTQSVKLISQFLNMPLIKLDASEYAGDDAISKLIGTSAGFLGYEDTAILDKIRINPFSIILIDEIEKASSKVLNLFLQILDEGIITNSKGEKLNFKNTYIFATSNVKMQHNIGFIDNIESISNYFSKELIARFDNIIEFNDITQDMVNTYLTKNGYNDLNIISPADYKETGFRGIKNKLKKINN